MCNSLFSTISFFSKLEIPSSQEKHQQKIEFLLELSLMFRFLSLIAYQLDGLLNSEAIYVEKHL